MSDKNRVAQTLFYNTADRTSMRSAALDLLRYPLTVLVVAEHTLGYPGLLKYLNSAQDLASSEAVGWLWRIVDSCIVSYNVPIFFFIAGYVFFLNTTLNRATYERKMKSRFRSLFVPYILWNLLAILVTLGLYYHAASTQPMSQTPVLTLRSILMAFWNSAQSIFPNPASHVIVPINMPLWFVKVLMGVALISPLIGWLNRKLGFWWPVLAGCVWMMVACDVDSAYRQWCNGVFFFSWGAWMSQHGHDMIEYFKRGRTASFILYPVLCIVLIIIHPRNIEVWEALRRVNNIIAVIAVFNISLWLIKRHNAHIGRLITASSFFVYCAHYLVYPQIMTVIGKVAMPHSGAGAVGALFATWIITVILLTGVYGILRRIMPRLLTIFSGGR